MNQELDKTRRLLLKAGLTLSVFSKTFTPIAHASTNSISTLSALLSDTDIFSELYALYGDRAYSIGESDIIVLRAPDIAENGQVVSIKLIGESNAISSFALLAKSNQRPLLASGTLHSACDLPLALRVKLRRTSEILLVADTYQGLIAVHSQVKVTIGCGGF